MEVEILAINDRYYPSQEDMMHPPCTRAVLVAGDIGDYAVYVGHGTPVFVARYGNKISFREATAQFSGLDEKKYRE